MSDLEATFKTLRTVMKPYVKQLDVVTDTDQHLYLNTRQLQKNRKPHFFGAVQLRKGAVSYHLMPLYTHPELLESVSPALRKRMQGKSCFNFSAVEPALVAELRDVTRAAFEEYRKAGYV